MMRSMVVPLDGSAMAEFALLPAAELARREGATVWLAVVQGDRAPALAASAGISAGARG